MDVTHVLFKDGDDRTLEKVIASNGGVQCVNVGWAVDCERFNARLPEKSYLIDLTRIPGSPGVSLSPSPQAPQPLSPLSTNTSTIAAIPPTPLRPTTLIPSTPQAGLNLGGSLFGVKTLSQTVGAKPRQQATSTPNWSFTIDEEDKENQQPPPSAPPKTSFLLGTPAGKDSSIQVAGKETTAATPKATIEFADSDQDTPYYLKTGSLVQMTCPPKQSQKEVGGVMLEEVKTPLRHKLLMAKRRSMEFAPRISSPLRRGF
ncbi:hypothetical protein LTS18_004982 [Coniosporium uncinatum]|uniref:Uncharacterized protein n=1 Tax=Coniosporium uncinatum TaxID=93489 RepID=A0ACC3D532_9PEZI|nr:hypothetical protein LTS18_004982 [Coniosporium uncinatum]